MARVFQLTAALAIFVACAAFANQGAGPQTPPPAGASAPATPAPQQGVLGPAQGFTGNTTTLDNTDYTVGRRVFEAGAHNSTWHAHTAGQLVFGEAGRGRLQIQGQPIKELGVGDSAFIPGGHVPLARRRAERKFHDDVRHDGRQQDDAGRAGHRSGVPREVAAARSCGR